MNTQKTICIILFIMIICKTNAQEILKLKNGITQQKVDVSQLSWLSENWKGTGFGGTLDELWMPISDNSMQGICRVYDKHKLQFTEYMNIIQENDSTVSLKLKHFSANLNGWEEKEEWTTFKLIKIENQTAYFSGITYQRKKNKLIIKLLMHDKEKEWIEEMVFYKKRF